MRKGKGYCATTPSDMHPWYPLGGVGPRDYLLAGARNKVESGAVRLPWGWTRAAGWGRVRQHTTTGCVIHLREENVMAFECIRSETTENGVLVLTLKIPPHATRSAAN